MALVSAADRVRAAVALVTMAQVFRENGETGHDDDARAALLAAGDAEIRELFADGTAPAVMALVRLVDLAVTYAAGTQQRSRERTWRVLASSAIELAGGGPALDVLLGE